MSNIIHMYMPDGGELGVIQIWYRASPSWVECRGIPYSQWRDRADDSPFGYIHEAVSGWCRAWLHADQIVEVFKWMPHHVRTWQAVEPTLKEST